MTVASRMAEHEVGWLVTASFRPGDQMLDARLTFLHPPIAKPAVVTIARSKPRDHRVLPACGPSPDHPDGLAASFLSVRYRSNFTQLLSALEPDCRKRQRGQYHPAS